MTDRSRVWMIAWVWLAIVTGLAGCQASDTSAQTPDMKERVRAASKQRRCGQDAAGVLGRCGQGTAGVLDAVTNHPEQSTWRRWQGLLVSPATPLLQRKQAATWMLQRLEQAPWLAATSTVQMLVPAWIALLRQRSSQDMQPLRAVVVLLVWAVAPVLPRWWAHDKGFSTQLSRLLVGSSSLLRSRVAVLLLSVCWLYPKGASPGWPLWGQQVDLLGGAWRPGLASMVVTIDAKALQQQRLHMVRSCELEPSWMKHLRMAKQDPRSDVREVATLALVRWQRRQEPFRRLLLSLSAASIKARHRARAHLRHKRPGAWGQITRILARKGSGHKGGDLSLSASYAAAVMSMYPHHQRLAPWSSLAQVLRKASDPGVRRYLIEALGRWPQKTGEKLGQRDRDTHHRHLMRLAWRARDTGVRDAALGALGSRRSTLRLWREAIAKRLQSRDWRQRRAALQAIALMVKRWRKAQRTGHKAHTKDTRLSRRKLPRALAAHQLLPLLKRGLKDPMTRVQSAAAIASAALKAGARPLFPDLQKLLKHRSWRLRYAGAEAFHLLGRHARPVVVELIAGLGDGNWGVRYSSSHALAAIGRAALPLLQTSLKSPQARERLATVDTLLRMKPRKPSQLYLSLLRLALQDRAASVRFAAIRGLHRVGKSAGSASLLRGSRDRDWRVREVALLALSTMPWSSRFRRVVVAGLRDTNGAVREAAVKVLGQCRLSSCQTLLLTALKDRHSLIQTKAAAALAGRTLSAAAIKALVAALVAQSSNVSPQSSSLSPQSSSLSPQPSSLSPQPSTLSPQPSNLSPQPSTLSPQPSSLSPQPSALQAAAAIALATGGALARKQLQALSASAPLPRLIGDLASVLWTKGAAPDASWTRLVRQLQTGTIAQKVRWRQACLVVLQRWLWLRDGLSLQVQPQRASHQKLLRLLQASQWSPSVALRRVSVALQVALLRLSDDGAMALAAPHPWVRQMMWQWWLSPTRWKRLRTRLQSAAGAIPRAILRAGQWRRALWRAAVKAAH